jgi:hypothetical protein
MTGYLPGDPRYGLSGEALRNYYRTKPAQWAIYCWDKPGTEATRRALQQDQKSYVEDFGERVIVPTYRIGIVKGDIVERDVRVLDGDGDGATI